MKKKLNHPLSFYRFHQIYVLFFQTSLFNPFYIYSENRIYIHEGHEEKHLENRMGEHTGSPLQNFYRYIRIVGADLCVCPSVLCRYCHKQRKIKYFSTKIDFLVSLRITEIVCHCEERSDVAIPTYFLFSVDIVTNRVKSNIFIIRGTLKEHEGFAINNIQTKNG